MQQSIERSVQGHPARTLAEAEARIKELETELATANKKLAAALASKPQKSKPSKSGKKGA